jgi:hypothetical protein
VFGCGAAEWVHASLPFPVLIPAGLAIFVRCNETQARGNDGECWAATGPDLRAAVPTLPKPKLDSQSQDFAGSPGCSLLHDLHASRADRKCPMGASMNAKGKGTRNKHRSIRILEAAGYACTRAAASLGAWDIVGVGSNFVLPGIFGDGNGFM